MAREATVRWIEKLKAWRSDVGPRGRSGRRTPVYFRRDKAGAEIPNTKAGERIARKLLREHLDERDEREAVGARGVDDPTVEQVALLWLSHVERTHTPQTYAVSKSAARQFITFAHHGSPYRARRAASLTATDLQRFLDARRAAGRKPHYLAKLAAVVQAMMNWAADPQPHRTPERLLPGGNPLRGMAAPSVPDSPERFAEARAIASFLKAWRASEAPKDRRSRAGRTARLAMLLVRGLVQTGARPGELCKAQWGDFDWEAGRTSAGHAFAKIVIPPERWKAGKKTGRSRTVYLTPTLTRALRREFGREDRHPTHPFWHVRRRKAAGPDAPRADPWNSGALADLIRRVRRKARAAGAEVIDEGPNRMVGYIFRHSAASRALMRGLDPVTLATLLGTSPKMIEKHYGHLLDDHLVRAAEQLAQARRPKA